MVRVRITQFASRGPIVGEVSGTDVELAVKDWGKFAQFMKDQQDRYAIVLCGLADFGQSAP